MLGTHGLVVTVVPTSLWLNKKAHFLKPSHVRDDIKTQKKKPDKTVISTLNLSPFSPHFICALSPRFVIRVISAARLHGNRPWQTERTELLHLFNSGSTQSVCIGDFMKRFGPEERK